MGNTSKYYEGPVLRVHVVATPAKAYEWEIEMSATDHSGTRKLGYKANGLLADLNSELGDFEILVHDESRPAWTPMPLSHRKDIRDSMESLLSAAIQTMKAGKHV